MTNSLTVSLPTCRIEQLQQISKIRGEPIDDLIESYIRSSWMDHSKSPELPGFDISGVLWEDTGEPVVLFSAYGTLCVPLSVPEACAVAHGFDCLANNSKSRFHVISKFDLPSTVFSGMKAGVNLTFYVSMETKKESKFVSFPLSRSLAVDLCTAFRAAVVEANNK